MRRDCVPALSPRASVQWRRARCGFSTSGASEAHAEHTRSKEGAAKQEEAKKRRQKEWSKAQKKRKAAALREDLTVRP